MSFQHQPFLVMSGSADPSVVNLCMKHARPIPDGIKGGMTVYLTTEPPKAKARTDDMQHVVEAEQSASAPGQGWRKVHDEEHMTTAIMDGKRTVCVVYASWLLEGATDEERNADLRQRREAYFRNVPLLVNAQRMFDLLCRLREDAAIFCDNALADELDQMVNEIKTQQWEPENPKG